MNIAFDIHEITIDNSIRFLDKRNNTIMEGDFTKLVYSDHCITLNGLYIHFPVHVISSPNLFTSVPISPHNLIVQSRERDRDIERKVLPPPPGLLYPVDLSINSHRKPYIQPNKLVISFHPSHPKNAAIVQDLLLFEKSLIDYYKQYMGSSNKTPAYSLKNQLLAGYMKFYRDTLTNTVSTVTSPENVHYMIKISGVWETRDTVGLTYKLLEMYTKS